MRFTFHFIFLLLPVSILAQNHPSISSIYKFQYGANKNSLKTMGLKLHSENENARGHYKVYWIDKSTGTYAVIQFSDVRKNYIYGVQITGYNQDLPIIDGLNLGDFKNEVFKFLGPPQDSSYLADVDLMHYSFENRSYSVEIDSERRLYSFAFYGDDGLLLKKGWSENWQNYLVSSIGRVSKSIQRNLLKEENAMYVGGRTTFRPRVKFTGNIRSISAENKKLIEWYFKSTNRTNIIDLFQSEIQVEEDSELYWLPIQEPLIDVFKEQTNNGDYPVDLFITHLGHNNDNITFIVNEFIVW